MNEVMQDPQGKAQASDTRPDVTIIIVSYNTKALTLRAIDSLLKTTLSTSYQLIVVDNDSSDGSAEAIDAAFPTARHPQFELVRSETNLGFAGANNLAARRAKAPRILLLNSDTICLEGAIDRLLDFAATSASAGLWGGVTRFEDGSLNPSSCWMRMTAWSLTCWAFGLTRAFRTSPLFNPEAIGARGITTPIEVDIVSGCFLLIDTALWRKLHGFDTAFVMYGEDADLCMRARALGARPSVTGAAQIIHLGGASTSSDAERRILVLSARAALVKSHWPYLLVPLGLSLLWLGAAIRLLLSLFGRRSTASQRQRSTASYHRRIWHQRQLWLSGLADRALVSDRGAEVR